MAGYPNPQDITALRHILKAVKVEEAEITKSKAELTEAEDRLGQAQGRYNDYLRKIEELMVKMDCSAPGNTGYKVRLVTLLIGIADQ